MKDSRTTPKPLPRFGGGLRAARESFASATVPSEMIGLFAALWASAAAVIIPILYILVSYWLNMEGELSLSMPESESLLERVLVSFVAMPILIVSFGMMYFISFGPFMVVITWGIKLLKLPRGISDVLGWMFIPPLFWAVIALTGLIDTTKYSPRWTEYVLFFGQLLMNGLGGLVYYLKQRQLHRETDG
jgi:hypothetical protein